MKAKAVLKGGSGRDFLGSLAQVNLATKIQMLHMILQLFLSQSVNEVCCVLTKAYFEKECLSWVNVSGSECCPSVVQAGSNTTKVKVCEMKTHLVNLHLSTEI